MSEGHRPTGCQRCWEEEDSGKKISLRQSHNRRWQELTPNAWDGSPQITFLEIGLSNLCNLKCRMCDSRYSSKWAGDEKSLLGKSHNPDPPRKFPVDKLRASFSQLRHIKFTGGEPLLIPEHQQILQELVDCGNSETIGVNYSTNVTVLPKPDLIEVWKKFGRIELALSVDGIGAVNDYVRNPSKWAQVQKVSEEFFRLAEGLPNLHLGIRPSVSVYNLLSQPQLMKWWLNLCEKFPLAGKRAQQWISPTHVTYPEILALQVLPPETKRIWQKQIFSQLDSLPDRVRSSLQSLCQYMLADDRSELFPEFIKFSQQLDELRNEKLAYAVPELEAAVIKYNEQQGLTL